MKRNFSLLILAIFLLGSISTVQAAPKKPFTGKVIFKITIDAKGLPEQAMAMLPKTMTYFVGESKTKTELFTQMGVQSSVEDLKLKTKVVLLELMGKKYALYETAEEVQEEMKETPELDLTFTDETKEIAGYTCKKVIATEKGSDKEFAVTWYTDELDCPEGINFSNPAFNQIQGMFLEFETDAMNGMKMTFTAIEVDAKKIKNKVFEIPSEFKRTTREELMGTLGG